VAAHQSGHNSGVIHSGIYYKPGSQKAKTCVVGAAAMIAFCREHSVPHQICGKVVVAAQLGEIPALEELHRRGVANGVPGVQFISPEQLQEIEPHSSGLRALHVPGAAITDFAAVTRKLAELFVAGGGEIITGAKVFGIARSGDEIIVETTRGAFQTRTIINCAGLHSDHVAKLAGADLDLQIVPFRGEYYEIAPHRRHLVNALIYPVPDPTFPFLGVHFTRKIQGGVEAGPNAVLAFQREGYRKTAFALSGAVETLSFPGFWLMSKRYWRTGLGEFYRSCSRKAFVRALQRLVPEIEEKDLLLGGAGVRAQALGRAGNLLDDFQIVRTERSIHVLNVPSPAATASLAIASFIADQLS
ncbi:MAG: L-2-hydroxyglutarate oxidase, partial [Acidobacteria bacterium]|nr:L-2-hydroxyglutarate oxidase [Acidobacteriota bacterium]